MVLGRGVITAGNALQFRKLIHQSRLQVGFRQFGGATCELRIDTDFGGNRFGQRGHARNLVGDCSELGLIGDGLEAFVHRSQTLLQILVVKELGIGKARANHALVAFADLGDILRFDVCDADEVSDQATITVEHREELLVGLHRGDQRFVRHRQEFRLEAAQHCARPFDQAIHLFEIVGVDARVAAGGFGGVRDFAHDALAALIRIDHDPGTAQRIDVIAGRADPHRLVVHETMAAAVASCVHAEQFGFDDIASEQQHQPVHRACERVIVVTPAHRLGDRHRRDRVAKNLRQQQGGCRARLDRAMHETLALVVGGSRKLRPRDAGLLREALQRPGRQALGVERNVEIGAEHFRRLLRLLDRYAGQQHREPARRIQRFRVAAVDRDAPLHQRIDHAVEERLRQARQRLDRQFLGAQFDQQRLHHAGSALRVGTGASNGR